MPLLLLLLDFETTLTHARLLLCQRARLRLALPLAPRLAAESDSEDERSSCTRPHASLPQLPRPTSSTTAQNVRRAPLLVFDGGVVAHSEAGEVESHRLDLPVHRVNVLNDLDGSAPLSNDRSDNRVGQVYRRGWKGR